MSVSDTPEVDFDALAFGLHLRNEADVARLAVGRDGPMEHWWLLLDVRDRCAVGDYAGLRSLLDVMFRHDDDLYWTAVANLVAGAGSWATIVEFIADLRAQLVSPAVDRQTAYILGMSCNLNAVEPLLRLHESLDTDDDQILVPHELSYLLEEEDGPIWRESYWTVNASRSSEDADRSKRSDPLPDKVRTIKLRLEREINVNRPYAFGGYSYDVVAIARRILNRLNSDTFVGDQEERLSREVIVFEAATGIDCSSMWTDDFELRPLAAATILEDFLDSPDLSRFAPGRRYFFGHPVPD